MKTVEKMKKNAPKFVDDTHVQVTKEFAKNARIFGTAEYKLWKAIKADCPEAEMVLKSIKKNPSKKNDTKNMTYERISSSCPSRQLLLFFCLFVCYTSKKLQRKVPTWRTMENTTSPSVCFS